MGKPSMCEELMQTLVDDDTPSSHSEPTHWVCGSPTFSGSCVTKWDMTSRLHRDTALKNSSSSRRGVRGSCLQQGRQTGMVMRRSQVSAEAWEIVVDAMQIGPTLDICQQACQCAVSPGKTNSLLLVWVACHGELEPPAVLESSVTYCRRATGKCFCFHF